MSNFPHDSASRRPEGGWGQEDEDFRIVPPPGVSAPPGSVSSAPPPAGMMGTPAPAPRPVAAQAWPTAVPACAALAQNPPSGADKGLLAQTYFACGLHLVQPAEPNVD